MRDFNGTPEGEIGENETRINKLLSQPAIATAQANIYARSETEIVEEKKEDRNQRQARISLGTQKPLIGF